MSWITLTESDVTTGRLTAAEIVKVTTVAAQGDSVAALIPQVSKYVAGFVAKRTALGVVGTIPEELTDAAAALIVWRFVSQIPSGALCTEARKGAKDDAEKLLRDVARGYFVVDPPDTGNPTQPTSPSPVIQRRRRSFTNRTTDGI